MPTRAAAAKARGGDVAQHGACPAPAQERGLDLEPRVPAGVELQAPHRGRGLVDDERVPLRQPGVAVEGAERERPRNRAPHEPFRNGAHTASRGARERTSRRTSQHLVACPKPWPER